MPRPCSTSSDVSVFYWSLLFLRPYRTRVCSIVALALVEIGLAALAPWPLKAVVDNVLGGLPLPAWLGSILGPIVGGSATMLLVVVVLTGLVLQVGHEVVRMFHTQLEVDTGQRIVYTLRERLLAHMQALPLRHHLLAK